MMNTISTEMEYSTAHCLRGWNREGLKLKYGMEGAMYWHQKQAPLSLTGRGCQQRKFQELLTLFLFQSYTQLHYGQTVFRSQVRCHRRHLTITLLRSKYFFIADTSTSAMARGNQRDKARVSGARHAK